MPKTIIFLTEIESMRKSKTQIRDHNIMAVLGAITWAILRKGKCELTNEEIGKKAGKISETTVIRAIGQLLDEDVIRVEFYYLKGSQGCQGKRRIISLRLPSAM